MESLYKVAASPTPFDSYANFMGHRPDQDWDCLLTQTRDSGPLERSNFASALRILGGESDDVIVHRYGHWGCGWWEALAVKQGTHAHETATEIDNALADYPVVDDEHHSQLEQEEADLIWRTCYDAKDRIAYIRAHRSQFEFSDWPTVRATVRGDYFTGYASELCQ